MSQVIELILIAEDLPSPPGVALRLLELYSQPSVEVKEMATVIGTDPVLTAKLIEYCNSPLLARNHVTTSVNQAIVVVGMRAVKILALSFSLVRSTPSNNASFDYEHFWNQSLATAVVAQTIGAARGGDGNDEFLLGLMMKIGQVGLAHTFPSKYAELQNQAEETGLAITQLEEQAWNSNHYDVGVKLLSHWNFPGAIVNGLAKFESMHYRGRGGLARSLDIWYLLPFALQGFVPLPECGSGNIGGLTDFNGAGRDRDRFGPCRFRGEGRGRQATGRIGSWCSRPRAQRSGIG